MAKPEDYRRYAAECLRLAQEFRGRAEAATLLDMAERWRRLANLKKPRAGEPYLRTKRRRGAARHRAGVPMLELAAECRGAPDRGLRSRLPGPGGASRDV
jgi:hypothetical protein